nr:carbamoyltransferase N-terminal domain-containing protein [bacterium]
MNILGISDNHNAGAALVVDGELIAAVNEERINRLKNSIGFPYEAIAEVLRLGGLQPAQIDRIVIAGDITPSCFLRIVPDLTGQFGMNYIAYTYYQIFARS